MSTQSATEIKKETEKKQTDPSLSQRLTDITTGESLSIWLTHPERKILQLPKLSSNITTDVCIIGTGITGLTTAYMLQQEGKRVVLLDSRQLCGGETGRTTAHLFSWLDDWYSNLEKMFSEEDIRMAASSHSKAIDQIEEIVRAEKIDCSFIRLPGYLFLDPSSSIDSLRSEFEAARRAGLDVSFHEKINVKGANLGPAIEFPNQGQFHPVKYIDTLANLIVQRGGQIFTHTHVQHVNGGDSPVVETEDKHEVKASAIVVATCAPISDVVTMYTKMEAYRSYAFAAKIPKDSISHSLFWDTSNPYNYVRTTPCDEKSEFLIVGGADHKTGQESPKHYSDHFSRLESWARERFPSMGEIVTRWSGQIYEPNDSLSYIGVDPAAKGNVYIATGDSGNGMTHGTIAGRLITDLIMGRTNPWTKVFDPSRKTIRAAGEWIKTQVNVAAVATKEWISGGDIGDIENLPCGQGALVRSGVKKIAVYKDETGKVFECDATCPHLKGIVQWNPIEKSWDCPLHGSRFDKFGRVICGPTRHNLTPVDKLDASSSL